MVEENFI